MKMIKGLFWDIEIKQKHVKNIPNQIWLDPDYLPGLEEAKKFDVSLLHECELVEIANKGETLICDIEIFYNYFLVSFMSYETGKCFYFEAQKGPLVEIEKLKWVLKTFKIITFNGNNFDIPLLALACEGRTVGEIKHACNMLILQQVKPWIMLRSFKVKSLEIDHIDLIEVCPLTGSLKIYGGRLHVPKMQDLPFDPETDLSEDQISILRFYCINDLQVTAYIYANLQDQILIREKMSTKYSIDLRSKSDAQIAEAVVKSELFKINGFKLVRPEISPGSTYRYHAPDFLKFKSEKLNELLECLKNTRFLVNEKGAIELPSFLKDLKIKIAKASYKIGIGGLHSTESAISHHACTQFALIDRDVASYYPAVILNQNLYPLHLGQDFISIYKSLVDQRLAAKKAGDKITADMLKIVINGLFGKFGSKWSLFYSPNLLIQVTITGQLALLMLAERLENAGVQVCSANTDGIVMRYPRAIQTTLDSIVENWEKETNFQTEKTAYSSIYYRDVNNYIALKPSGGFKGKGVFSNPWIEKGSEIFRFHKNPCNQICVEAITEYLKNKTPLGNTIKSCRDFRKFITVKVVKGGGVKNGVYLGKAVRWYLSTNCGGPIVYAKSGNKVALSEGGRPCLELPKEFPLDVDFEAYEQIAFEMLNDIAAV